MAYIKCICLEGLATAHNIRNGIASLVVTFFNYRHLEYKAIVKVYV